MSPASISLEAGVLARVDRQLVRKQLGDRGQVDQRLTERWPSAELAASEGRLRHHDGAHASEEQNLPVGPHAVDASLPADVGTRR